MGAVDMFQPYDMRPTVEVTIFTLASVSTAVVAIRLGCRIWTVNRLKLYDYIMCSALLCTWALCACNHYQLHFGAGTQGRFMSIPPGITQQEKEALKRYSLYGSAATWYAYHMGYLLDLGLIKLSVLVFYLSFATNRTFRILVYTSIGAVAAASIIMIFVNAFQCPKKPHYALTPSIVQDRRSTYCFALTRLMYWQASFNLASDVVILILPMPILYRLRLGTRKRLLLLALFSVSLLVPIASGIRFWAIYLWVQSGSMARYHGGYIIFWSQVEINTAIICASTPSLQPLLTHFFGKLSIFQRSRGAHYFYGGGRGSLTQQSSLAAADLRSATLSPTMRMERPCPAYHSAKQEVRETSVEQNLVSVRRLTEEDIIRERVRAFANRSSPVYPQPTLHTHYTPVVTNG